MVYDSGAEGIISMGGGGVSGSGTAASPTALRPPDC